MSTVTVVDSSRIGKKGFPMHSGAFPDIALPTKEVPASEATPEQAVDPKQALTLYAADKRWQKETGGFEFNGLHIATDDRSKIMIAGAREAAKANPNFTTPWVTTTGEIALLDAAAVIAISDAVGVHVNNVFGIYSQVLPQILDGTIIDQSQIDAAFA